MQSLGWRVGIGDYGLGLGIRGGGLGLRVDVRDWSVESCMERGIGNGVRMSRCAERHVECILVQDENVKVCREAKRGREGGRKGGGRRAGVSEGEAGR